MHSRVQCTPTLIAGTLLPITTNLAFKPTTLVKVTSGALIFPVFHPGVMRAIHELHYYMTVDVAIHIGQDFSPETFCQGYDEIESYDDIIPAK